jgi:hypothetical protein
MLFVRHHDWVYITLYFFITTVRYVILPDSVKKSGTNFLDSFRYTFNKWFAFNKSMMVVPNLDHELNFTRILVIETSLLY